MHDQSRSRGPQCHLVVSRVEIEDEGCMHKAVSDTIFCVHFKGTSKLTCRDQVKRIITSKLTGGDQVKRIIVPSCSEAC